jgi:hypothetical protein
MSPLALFSAVSAFSAITVTPVRRKVIFSLSAMGGCEANTPLKRSRKPILVERRKQTRRLEPPERKGRESNLSAIMWVSISPIAGRGKTA